MTPEVALNIITYNPDSDDADFITPRTIAPGNVMFAWREQSRDYTVRNSRDKFRDPMLTMINVKAGLASVRYNATELPSGRETASSLPVIDALMKAGASLQPFRFREESDFGNWRDGYINLDRVKGAHKWFFHSEEKTTVIFDDASTLVVAMPCREFRNAWKPHHPDPAVSNAAL